MGQGLAAGLWTGSWTVESAPCQTSEAWGSSLLGGAVMSVV